MKTAAGSGAAEAIRFAAFLLLWMMENPRPKAGTGSAVMALPGAQ